ncbi:MAG: YciI family protein, partial [Parvibaculaceae bacterium]|nr:YciI family protein [Parvibaculaceae bacterium]
MIYSILIYGNEDVFEQLTAEEQDKVMAKHRELQGKLKARGQFASFKLMPTNQAVTLRAPDKADEKPLIVDGPFAETKERFLGIYAAEFSSMKDAIDHARLLSSQSV